MLKILFVFYLVCIHLLIVVMLVKTDFIDRVKLKVGMSVESDELSEFYFDMVTYHKRLDPLIPDHAVLFIGDSFVQSLATSAITPFGVNLGIGSDTTVGVLNRLNEYQSIQRTKSIVFAIGGNDLKRRDPDEIVANYQKILQMIPETSDVFVIGMHPVDETVKQSKGRTNKRINELNMKLRNLSSTYSNITYFSMEETLRDGQGDLKKQYHEGDGVHLSPLGYRVWINEFKKMMNISK